MILRPPGLCVLRTVWLAGAALALAGAASGCSGGEKAGVAPHAKAASPAPTQSGPVPSSGVVQTPPPSYGDYLRTSAVPREMIDKFLDPDSPTWAKFDPELGYVLGKSMPHDGVDGSGTISTSQPGGARTQTHYADRPCRINTYGDSFTQCHQVSDGETWQEVLAAHFGEPIRNFGMGGYGSYQAYRRMIREERKEHGADHVILYLWGDDHLRNVMRCRYAAIHPVWGGTEGIMFHNNFWPNIELDLASGEWIERENPLNTPESLYKMCDAGFMEEALKDDLMLQLHTVATGRVDPYSIDLDALAKLAGMLKQPPPDRTSADSLRRSLEPIMHAYGFAATGRVLSLAEDFCRRHGKKLLILTLDPQVISQLLKGLPRQDQALMDILKGSGLRHVDMNLAHLRDYQSGFKCDAETYMGRFFIGHYNPQGNHFFAFALKDELVKWLDPPPVTYRSLDENTVSFKGYLPY